MSHFNGNISSSSTSSLEFLVPSSVPPTPKVEQAIQRLKLATGNGKSTELKQMAMLEFLQTAASMNDAERLSFAANYSKKKHRSGGRTHHQCTNCQKHKTKCDNGERCASCIKKNWECKRRVQVNPEFEEKEDEIVIEPPQEEPSFMAAFLADINASAAVSPNWENDFNADWFAETPFSFELK
jgi:hypothetical protein